jgi:hypothetical protein
VESVYQRLLCFYYELAADTMITFVSVGRFAPDLSQLVLSL